MIGSGFDFALIIPCFNEAGSIPALLDACVELDNSEAKIQFIFVNNGSTDSSGFLLNEKSKILKCVEVIHLPYNMGYGGGLTQGLQQVTAPVAAWTHADLQTPAINVLEAYRIFKASSPYPTLVKGMRLGRPLIDVIFTKLMSFAVFIFTGMMVSDVNAQPKLFSMTLFERLKGKSPLDFSFDLFVLLLAKKSGTIIEFPVEFKARIHGHAKGGAGSLFQKLQVSWSTLKFISKIKMNDY